MPRDRCFDYQSFPHFGLIFFTEKVMYPFDKKCAVLLLGRLFHKLIRLLLYAPMCRGLIRLFTYRVDFINPRFVWQIFIP
jgi:hypothetical protein